MKKREGENRKSSSVSDLLVVISRAYPRFLSLFLAPRNISSGRSVMIVFLN